MPNTSFPKLPAFAFPFPGAGETSPSTALTEELPGGLSDVLEQLLNEVRAWLEAPETERPRCDDAPSLESLPAELVAPVRRTLELLREVPDDQTQLALGLGLLIVAEWAERNHIRRYGAR